MSQMNNGTLADLKNQVNISQVLGGYFGDLQVAHAFVELGIKPILSSLPITVKMADVGGGEGLLASAVRDFLVAHGHQVEAYVIDSNPIFVEECGKRALYGLVSDIRDFPIKGFDLIIMRAVLHYNSHNNQIELLKSIQRALAPTGKLVAQILTGSTINCKLRQKLISLKTLGDDILAGYYNSHSFEELEQLLHTIGFASVKDIGAAPDLKWTLEQQWSRFNGSINDELKGGEGPYAQMTKKALFELFSKEVLQIIEEFMNQFGRDEVKVDLSDAINPVIYNDYRIYCCSK